MKYFGWIFLFFIVVYILPLASRPLLGPVEFHTGNVAYGLVVSDDWSKIAEPSEHEPPEMVASYVPVAASIRLFGKNSFAIRFPMALAAGVTALFIWMLVRQVLRDDKLAALASVIFLSCAGVYLFATSAVGDALFAMLIVGSCGVCFEALQEPKFNRRRVLLLLIFAVFIALAFAVRGGAALAVPIFALGGYLLGRRDWKGFLTVVLPGTVLGAGAIALWAWMQWSAAPAYWRYFITDGAWRIFSGRGLIELPWYTYLLVFTLGSFPAVLLVPSAICAGRDAWKKLFKQKLYAFALSFWLLPLIFFSFFSGKQPGVVLCCFAPFALLVAGGVREYFNNGGHNRSYNWIMTCWGALLSLFGIFFAIAEIWPGSWSGRIMGTLPVTASCNPLLSIVCLGSGGVMFYSLRGNWRGRMYLFFISVALLPLFGNWCIAGSPQAPHRALRMLQRELGYSSGNTVFFVVPELQEELKWSCEPETVFDIGDGEQLIEAINSPERKAPLVVVFRKEADAKMISAIRGKLTVAGREESLDGVCAVIFAGR